MAFRRPVCFMCLLFILSAPATFVQSSVSALSGTEFVFAPMPNHPNYIIHSIIGMILQGTTNESTTVHISLPGKSLEERITLTPGSGLRKYPLPRELIHQTTSGPIDSTIHVVSDKAITVVHYNLDPSNSDMFTVMPAESLGQEYFIATITWGGNPTEGSGVVTISSLGDGVSIEIHMTSTLQFVDETFDAGDVFRYTLHPFKSIQLLPQFTGITGTRIITNTSIAVSTGAKCANVPEGVQYCDHIAEQLAPFTSWGKMFLLSPFVSRGSGYVFQVVTGRDQTTVLYGNIVLRLNMGDFRTIDVPSQTMTFVSADKPITVMQYPKGRRSDGTDNSDPSMIRVSPIEQYVQEATFPVHEFGEEYTYIESIHLELTAECKHLKNISIFKDYQSLSLTWNENYSMEILDGTRICSQWTLVSGGSYILRSQRMTTTEGQAFYPRFRAVVYGTGQGESYLYRAASGDRPLTCSFNPSGAGPAEEHDCPILVNPEVVSLMATKLNITWSTSPDNTGLFETCSVSITSGEGINRVVAITTHPPATLSGLHPYTEYTFYLNCSNSLGMRTRLEFPAQTTLKAEPHPPTNVLVTEVTQTSAVVSWEPPRVTRGNGTVDGYVVFTELQNCLSSSCSTVLKYFKTEAASQNLHLDPFATYRVIVIAYTIDSRIPSPGDILNSSQATSEEFTTLKAEPGPPNNVSVKEVTESSAIVSWTQPLFSHGPVDGYTVYAVPVSCSSLSCTTDTTDVTANILEHTLVLRPYLSYRAVVVAFALELRISDHMKLNSSLAYSEIFTTLQTVPVKPPTPTIVSGGIRDYSFDINIPAYRNPNGPISCFEVIVVQLYDETTSINSNDNAYGINNTRDYSIARNRIGTPFSAMVFSTIPAGNVITVGSRYEVQSECNTWGEANEDHRKRRATVRATTLHSTGGPLNPDSFYSCFIRVYSPSHQDGDVYFVNGPFIEPIRLKVEVPGSGTHVTLTIVCIAVTLVVIGVIVIFICLRKRKRSRRQRNRGSPAAPAGFTTTHRMCTDPLPAAHSTTSTGNQQVDHSYHEYQPSKPINQTVNNDLVEGEYEFMIYKSDTRVLQL
eukprot:XP_011667983.1 PREDICTED: uncharacterized protein LOC100890084 isoform X3 [Strongylocentrotus purpuratus]